MQGVGAALMNPATLSIITATFPPRLRGTAIGIWAGVSALALAIGPLVGGVLTERISWSWIFFVNVPVGIVAVLAARAFIDEIEGHLARAAARSPGPGHLGGRPLRPDLRADRDEHACLGLDPRRSACWRSRSSRSSLFVLLESRQRLPMLDLSLFRNPTFSGANTVMGLVGLAMFGIFFFNSLFLQNVLGYSAIKTGATFLPMTLLIILVAPVAGRFTDRIGPRWPMAAGMTLLTGSLLLFGTLDAQSSFWNILPGLRRRRLRDGDHDGADDRRRDGLGAGRQGRRRLGRDQQHAPGRRLARDRDHGHAGRRRTITVSAGQPARTTPSSSRDITGRSRSAQRSCSPAPSSPR